MSVRTKSVLFENYSKKKDDKKTKKDDEKKMKKACKSYIAIRLSALQTLN